MHTKIFVLKLVLSCESNDPIDYVTPEIVASGVHAKLDSSWDESSSIRTRVKDVSVWPGGREQLILRLDQLEVALRDLRSAVEGGA